MTNTHTHTHAIQAERGPMTEEALSRRCAEADGDGEMLLPGLVFLKAQESGFGRLEASARHAGHGEMRDPDTRRAVAVAASILEPS